MARRFTPRHKAKPEEAERIIPKPPRFNQKPRSEVGDIMYALNRTIPEGVVDLLSLGCASITRTITETAIDSPKISLRAICHVIGANDNLASFVSQCADQMHNDNQSAALGNFTMRYANFFHYEGTVYAVTQMDMDEGESVEYQTMHGVTQRRSLANGYVTIIGEALPDIIKLKTGEDT